MHHHENLDPDATPPKPSNPNERQPTITDLPYKVVGYRSGVLAAFKTKTMAEKWVKGKGPGFSVVGPT